MKVDPVLLIDDDEDIRVLAELSLRSAGLDVVSCESGAAGLKILESEKFALIILDVMMPDMSGFEVLHEIFRKYGEHSPPVAMFSARPQDLTEKDCLGLRVVGFLPKPFDPRRLADKVLNYINEHH